MNNNGLQAADTALTTATAAEDRDSKGQFVPGNPHRWQPGQSGRTLGRADSLVDHLTRLGREKLEDGRTRNQALAEALWSIALTSKSQRYKLQAIEVLMDRLLGKPSQSLKVGIGPGQPTETELSDEIQTRLMERGLSAAESQRFLLAIGATDEPDQ